jgi:hypothetical protein
MGAKRFLAPDDPRHGTANGYINLGCRCVPCKGAYADWMREARARRASREIPEHIHGTENGYCNYVCHCEKCTEAHRQKRRLDRERKEREEVAS